MKKILIVDDDPLITTVYAKHFRADGFDVRVASSGQAGLDEVRSFLPDAVLLDLHMPGVNGVQWLDEIRKDARFAQLPVTVFTAGEIGWQLWAARNSNVNFIFKEGAQPLGVVRAINAVLAMAAGPPPAASRTPAADAAGRMRTP